MQADLKHPGVPFPPPLLFVAGFGAGLLLNRTWPVNLIGTLPFLLPVLGWLCIGLGALILAAGMVTFWQQRTAIYPNQPASRLVRSGPYRFTRNPMYVGLTLVYLGGVLLVNALWPLIILPLVLVILGRVVIRREERYLTQAFGEAYERYCQQVGRWL